ncbi:MAG: hypothetical protein ABJF23_25505 [Bryobacteraceae bacterium]
MFQDRTATLEEVDESSLRTPLLLRATVVPLALNLAIGLFFLVSPDLSSHPAEVRAATQSYDASNDKISPFQPVTIEKARRTAKLPVRIAPVIAQVIPEETIPPVGNLN